MGSIFLVLVIVALAIGAFVYLVSRIFKKQSALLEQQESELVALRRASLSAGTAGLGGSASEGNILEEQK